MAEEKELNKLIERTLLLETLIDRASRKQLDRAHGLLIDFTIGPAIESDTELREFIKDVMLSDYGLSDNPRAVDVRDVFFLEDAREVSL